MLTKNNVENIENIMIIFYYFFFDEKYYEHWMQGRYKQGFNQ